MCRFSTCNKHLKQLAMYVDGCLCESQMHQIGLHISKCPVCAEQTDSSRMVKALLQTKFEPMCMQTPHKTQLLAMFEQRLNINILQIAQ